VTPSPPHQVVEEVVEAARRAGANPDATRISDSDLSTLRSILSRATDPDAPVLALMLARLTEVLGLFLKVPTSRPIERALDPAPPFIQVAFRLPPPALQIDGLQ
jgi:hypothetical protein